VKDFHLIETMRVSNGEVYLLDRHIARLSGSASHFSFHCDVAKVHDEIVSAASRADGSACLRLTLSEQGETALQSGPLPGPYVQRLRLSTVRVNSTDEFLYHKTTKRSVYEAARRECDEYTDAILVNERGEITETTVMNLAVLRDGHWVTPQLSCGLLPGILRQELLARGEIVEGEIPSADLRSGELVRCFNALRGVCETRFE
jgi:para-aminobenzoate synthetase/4-amino-4-deoxychorismate lyase